MSKLESQELETFQEHSEVDLFYKIGIMAENLWYTPIYFKALKPKIITSCFNINLF